MGFFKKRDKKKSVREIEEEIADIRHTVKNYLNMLTFAEFQYYGNNNITSEATQFLDSNLVAKKLL